MGQFFKKIANETFYMYKQTYISIIGFVKQWKNENGKEKIKILKVEFVEIVFY